MDASFVLRASNRREYPISGATRIGRDETAQIVLNDPSVSRHHATVWVEQDTLLVVDENSINGVLINGKRIPPGRPKRLRQGDRLRIGAAELFVSAGKESTVKLPKAAARRWPLFACATLFGIILIAAIVFPVAGMYLFNWQFPFPGISVAQNPTPATPIISGSATATLAYPAGQASTPGPQTISLTPSVVNVSTPEPLLKPQEFAASSEQLPRAVAELNQSELEFVRAAQGVSGHTASGFLARLLFFAPGADELDDKLLQVAADALQVAAIADSLSQTAAAQEGGSDNAGKVASQYTSVAQLAAALVIDAQNLRDKLTNGEITPLAAAALIAEYGGRLWNPTVTDPATQGNPFTPLVADPSTIPAPQTITTQDLNNLLEAFGQPPVSWLAASAETETKTLTVPPSSAPPVDANDPALITKLTTTEGQKTAPDAARQMAAAIIQAGGGSDLTNDQPMGGEVVAAFWSAVAVASPNNPGDTGTPSRTLPTFPGGKATTLTKGGDSGDVISTLINIGSGGEPTVDGQVTVAETKPVVALTLSNLTIKQVNKRPKDAFSTFEADVLYEFDVQWQSNLVAPQFELDCAGGNHFDIATAGGSQHMSAKAYLILYPGAETAYCYASHNGNTWGSASIRFLVGDEAGATQRAEQVETDSVSLNLTLTADSLGTENAKQTQAAATQGSLATENAVATEVYGTQTAEFIATVTEIARRTENAPTPLPTDTPQPTPTFEPVLVDSLYIPGNVAALSTSVVLQPGRLYRICLSGTVYLTDGPVAAYELMHVNGIGVPVSGCMVLEGTGAVATITCGHGTPAEEPGGYAIQVFDLGPS